MKFIAKFALLAAAGTFLLTPAMLTPAVAQDQTPDPSDWAAVLEQAEGQEVFFNAWGGGDNINDYIAWAGEQVEERFGVTLTHVKVADTSDVVSRVLAEKAAGRNEGGAVDLIWINGENFAAMKREGLLLDQPWSVDLPNYQYADVEGKDVLTMDFTESVDGLESPWGTAQLTYYYDSEYVDKPPRALDALKSWIAENPGRFTYAAPPDFIGTTFLKQVLYGLIEDPDLLSEPVDEATFDEVTAPLWTYLDEIRPNLWRQGQVYAADVTNLQTLLADGETSIAMTFNPGAASAAIADGILPETVRSFVPDYGSIGNASFLAIPFNASARAGAMVVANFMLSPEAQAMKADETVWGDPTVINYDALSAGQQALFDDLDQGPATLGADELGDVLVEPDASWTAALEAEWLSRYGA